MFDKLEDLLMRFEEILNLLNDPAVIADQARFQQLMKEQGSLQPIVDAYKEYNDYDHSYYYCAVIIPMHDLPPYRYAAHHAR